MPLILGTNSIKDTGYEVANSCRFDDGSSDYLSRTPSSGGNRRTFTISCWLKRSTLGGGKIITGINDGSDPYARIFFDTNDVLKIEDNDGGTDTDIVTNRVFRDTSAYYHIVVAYDTTQSTASNRIKLYVNGVQETSFSTETYPAQNFDTEYNKSSTAMNIGKFSSSYFDGYMAEVVFIDGSALDPTSFGEFDSDSPTIWKPKDVSGLTFGTNGFYLDFENASSLGADVSGNSNNFTVNNLTSVDQSIDTCTNNFATFNPLNLPSSSVLSEGNLDVQTSGSSRDTAFSTIGVSKGKWYAEFKLVAGEGGNVRMDIGINGDPAEITRSVVPIGNGTTGFSFDGESAVKVTNGSNSGSFGSALSIGDIVMLAVDLDNLKIYFGKNGTFFESGDPTSGSTGTGSAFDLTAPASTPSGFYFLGCSDHSVGFNQNFHANFGSPPFSISSGNSDAEGFGNFEFAVPSGYFALCTKNLAEYG